MSVIGALMLAVLAAGQEATLLDNPAEIPVGFTYGGRPYRGLGWVKEAKRTDEKTASGRKLTLEGRLDRFLKVRLEAAWCAEYDQTEWTLWFENDSKEHAPAITDLVSCDLRLKGAAPRVRGILGDYENQYRPYDEDLAKGPVAWESKTGRATHWVFPYFDVQHGDGGTMVALGWAGTWKAEFSATADGARMVGRNVPALNVALRPGERIRTALVVLLPYRGRDLDAASNRWRAWYMKHVLPKANAKGDPIRPLTAAGFAGDTGLPNSDGSVSENHRSWKPTLDKLVAEKLVPDFRWFDAGWYCNAAGESIPKLWWQVGTHALDTNKWPGASFRESVEAGHRLGMKTLVWFEPERVYDVTSLVRNFGYDAEWGVNCDEGEGGDTGQDYNNIGNPACFAWTLDRILAMLRENDVDFYREDNNLSFRVRAWRMLDIGSIRWVDEPRDGISEQKGVQAHYALWDAIIADAAKRGKCTFVDSCASGGGRNDIESMRRGFPMMRSDADRTTVALRLSMSWGFNRWIPFHGSCTSERTEQLGKDLARKGPDAYVSRASYLPVYEYFHAFSHNKDLDFDLIRRNIAEWRSVSHLLVRDFYPLTPWHEPTFEAGWTVFAYDAPELGESVVLALRMPKAEERTYTAKLKFADPKATYELRDEDTGRAWRQTGDELRTTGFAITLEKPRSSALVRIRRLSASDGVL